MVVELIRHGCPVCGGDVKGNDEILFYCRPCSLLFKRRDLAEEENVEVLEDEEAEVPERLETPVELEPEPVSGLSDEQLVDKFIVSKKAFKYHNIKCPYISRIKRENLFFFNSREEAENREYKPCVCIKNMDKASEKGTYVMSEEGGEYHYSHCPFAMKIKKKVYFEDEQKALSKGLGKCQCIIEGEKNG